MNHSPTINAPGTLVEALTASLRACDGTPDGMARPAAILWTDPERHWLPLRSLLIQAIPELIVFGEYDPSLRTGPGIWVRCVVDRKLKEPVLPPDRVPIVYLPGVGRQDLRAGEDCSASLRPLVELMYRGTLWLQRGGHDWTVTAFLTSPQGLGLDIARDQTTLTALFRALREIAETPISYLRQRGQLAADDFDRLLSSDVVRDLLRWMSEPAAAQERMGAERWQAFRNQCRSQFKFDPESEGVLTAGEKLGLGEDEWEMVWSRFEEAPQSYSGIPDLLRRAKPATLLFDQSRWPDANESAEQTVRERLSELPSLRHAEACDLVVKLEAEHSERRDWVWARMGMAPLATVLKPLSVLANFARSALGGTTPNEIAQAYTAGVWQADAASWEAVAAAKLTEQYLVMRSVRALVLPWLEDSARAFQRVVETQPLPGRAGQPAIVAEPGECLLFVDGLRYDIGQRLAQRLEGRGCRIRVGWRWSGLPTVTATAKPAVTPVADEVSGANLPADFAPRIGRAGKTANAAALREAMREKGFQLLGMDLGDWPAGDEARSWLETGQLDRRGHDLGDELALHLDAEIDRVTEQVVKLLHAGWKTVRVVTDHGWLLMPGGLPKVDLPRHLTESRWPRCAVIAGNSQVDAMTIPWHWNPSERFATAPGVACFNASPSYTHGGISVQECVIPELTVERGGGAESAAARIRAVTWRGMRCFVEVEHAAVNTKADLRLHSPSGTSVVASVKTLDKDGTASLVVADDAHETADLVLVLTDDAGSIIAQRKTKVGASG